MTNSAALLKKRLYQYRFLIPLLVIVAIGFCYYYFPLTPTQRITLISALVVAGSLIFSLITIEGNERTFTYACPTSLISMVLNFLLTIELSILSFHPAQN
jgi:hypothetical protein